MTSRFRVVSIALLAGVMSLAALAQGPQLPCRPGSVRFGVIGDFGDGSKGEYAMAARFGERHAACAFETVITVGDNI